MPNHIQRREFIKLGAAAALSFSIIPNFLKAAPSDRLRIAHIGLGGMGNQHMRWFAGLPDVEIVALSDVDSNRLEASLEALKTLHPGASAKTYKDFRHILDRKDVDAITCATPDHWHAQIAMLAFDAGKDVYGEKPLSYDVREGQNMLKELERHNRIFQLGTQIHAGENYHRVAELLQADVIGKVHTVRLWKTSTAVDLGFPKPQSPPPHLDWDMWLGPAPYAEYFPERCHRTYRHFLDYSGGTFADFWCHIADIVWWSIRPQGLKRISARGEECDGIADAPKWLDADFEFENLKLFWTTDPPNVPGAQNRGIGAFFEGEKGTLICDYQSRAITINGETVEDVPSIPRTLPRSEGHQRNFVDSVKSRRPPESNLAYAREMTLPMHLALISWRLGRPVNWNFEKEKFIKDKGANQLLSRRYRKEWNLV